MCQPVLAILLYLHVHSNIKIRPTIQKLKIFKIVRVMKSLNKPKFKSVKNKNKNKIVCAFIF